MFVLELVPTHPQNETVSTVFVCLTLLLPRVLSSKQKKKIFNFILKIVKNKQHRMKVLLNSFHLNAHTLGFYPHTQKEQPHLMTQGLTLGVKGLKDSLGNITCR